jgi:hypothetical protein
MSTTKTDLDEFLRLMAESRKQGYRIGPEVTIGCISVKVKDMKLDKKLGIQEMREPSILEEHGWPGEDAE